MNITEQSWALNFLVLATELKLLIFKISARTFLKNFSFRKELKLFATSCKYLINNNLRTKRNSEPWFFSFAATPWWFFFIKEKEWQMKILTQFGIFIRIIILTIGSKKAHTQNIKLTFVFSKSHYRYFRIYPDPTRKTTMPKTSIYI